MHYKLIQEIIFIVVYDVTSSHWELTINYNYYNSAPSSARWQAFNLSDNVWLHAWVHSIYYYSFKVMISIIGMIDTRDLFNIKAIYFQVQTLIAIIKG